MAKAMALDDIAVLMVKNNNIESVLVVVLRCVGCIGAVFYETFDRSNAALIRKEHHLVRACWQMTREVPKNFGLRTFAVSAVRQTADKRLLKEKVTIY